MRKSKNRLAEAEAEVRLSRWGLMAHDQWKRHAPKHYKALQKAGKLYQALHSAQEQAKDQFVKAVQRGDDPHLAHRSAEESLYRFDPENDPAREEPWEEEAALDSAMQATRRLLEEPSEAMPQGQLEFEGLVESEGRTSGNEMREPLLANRDPLCQVAKSKLLELGVEPDPDQLYPLQLMNWAAGHGLVVVRPGLAWRQQEVRQVLEGMEPEAALRFLTECGPEERIDDPEALAEMEPADAAAELFEMLHSRMAATLEDYPLPRSD